MSENVSWQQVDSLRVYGRHILLLQIPMVARFCLELGNTGILLLLKD